MMYMQKLHSRAAIVVKFVFQSCAEIIKAMKVSDDNMLMATRRRNAVGVKRPVVCIWNMMESS